VEEIDNNFNVADDSELLSETPEGLQNMLNELSNYCDKWKLLVNIDKNKIVTFRNGGINRHNETWEYKNCPVEIVSSFNYLGASYLILTENLLYRKKFWQPKVGKLCLLCRNI